MSTSIIRWHESRGLDKPSPTEAASNLALVLFFATNGYNAGGSSTLLSLSLYMENFSVGVSDVTALVCQA